MPDKWNYCVQTVDCRQTALCNRIVFDEKATQAILIGRYLSYAD